MAEEIKKETVSGTVERITYRNTENSYTVLALATQDGVLTVVGTLPFINEGDFLTCEGEYTYHANYGEQFKASRVEKTVKNDAASLLRYLSSGSIKGVGPATARLIVQRFGEDTLKIIENEFERLAEIKGISYSKAESIHDEYLKQFGLQDIVMFLSAFGVNADEALKIYKQLGSKATDIVKDNPYVLCNEEIGFSFDRVEEIAIALGFDTTRSERINAGILYVLRKNLGNGHTCLPKDKLIPVAANLLDADERDVGFAVEDLVDSLQLNSEFIEGREFLFLPEYYNAERRIAARLMSIKDYIPSVFSVSKLEIDRCENRVGIKFGDLQRKAIISAVENGLLILTGGPGTGKTTTLNAIIEILGYRNLNVMLAAPTGRAAKRMTELTGVAAKTLHRLLECSFGENGKQIFGKNEKNPLDCDAIIIDEMSMVDTLLFENLIKALKSSCRIIMVGDSDQLPSVGAGNVLSDLIMSDCLPAVRLETVFRQGLESKIVTNAHSIIGGGKISLKNEADSDFFMMKRSNPADTVNAVLELVTERIPAAYGFSPKEDIQVLCPSRKMDAGSVNLNNLLQSFLNPRETSKKEMAYKGIYYRVGDKVMQIKNNYDIVWKRDNGEDGSGVFNGDIGVITDIDKRAGMMKVRFEDKTADYLSEEIGELELAYAITVHKSQGSEFNCVIMPLIDAPQMLRYRNLLYTGVTRAKKLLIIVGSESVFLQMAANDKRMLRYTGLVKFLREADK
ncbi:MAG: ATP-dependent RecD-like DNA helicase [Clostridiales bacterium]|nr:ATP-dependent RecD-like DNA helicase [Candidatus Equinaster intestinalis]